MHVTHICIIVDNHNGMVLHYIMYFDLCPQLTCLVFALTLDHEYNFGLIFVLCNERLRNYVYCMSSVLWTHLEHSYLISIYIVVHCTYI